MDEDAALYADIGIEKTGGIAGYAVGGRKLFSVIDPTSWDMARRELLVLTGMVLKNGIEPRSEIGPELPPAEPAPERVWGCDWDGRDPRERLGTTRRRTTPRGTTPPTG